MRCNCENSHCRLCAGKGCNNAAGVQRAMYIGPICDGCASNMPAEYLLPTTYQRAFDVGLEEEIPLRGDHYMLDIEMGYELTGPMDDEGMHWPICDPLFIFRLLEYNTLVENYEIDITDTLTEAENIELQRLCYELYNDHVAAMAEARYDRD